MVAPEMEVDARAVLCVGGLQLSVPVQFHDVIVECDLQLSVRVSAEMQQLTMLGIMLNKPVEMDYRLKLCGLFELTSLPMLCGYVNNGVNDSLYHMRKPKVMPIPFMYGAELDDELSRPTRNVGMLEIYVISARNLSRMNMNKLEPYVRVSLKQRNPPHDKVLDASGRPRFELKTHAITSADKTDKQEPMWGQEMWLYLKADECSQNLKADEGARLTFEVYDDVVGKDVLLGEAHIDLPGIWSIPAYRRGKAELLELKEKGQSDDPLGEAPAAGEGSPEKKSPKSTVSRQSSRDSVAPPELLVQVTCHQKILSAGGLPMAPRIVDIQPDHVEAGILEIKIKACRRLVATTGNKDSPYVHVELGGRYEQMTSVWKDHSYPTWPQEGHPEDEGSFDFAVSDMAKVIKIQVNDARSSDNPKPYSDTRIGCVLRNKARDHSDFPTVPEFLALVGLLQNGKVQLMKKADLWLPLNDPSTGKRTEQEIRVEVAFRACLEYKPHCEAVLVTNLPPKWTRDRSVGQLKQLLQVAFRNTGTHESLSKETEDPVHELYTQATAEVPHRDSDDAGGAETTWALVILDSVDKATSVLRAKKFSEESLKLVAEDLRSAAGDRTASAASDQDLNELAMKWGDEMKLLDPSPPHTHASFRDSEPDRVIVPTGVKDSFSPEDKQAYSNCWKRYVHGAHSLLALLGKSAALLAAG